MKDIKKIIFIKPMGKPRMTRSDKWKKRGCVIDYWAYGDILRKSFNRSTKFDEAPETLDWTCYFGFPKSYSKKKREELKGRPHREKPDRDNIDKGILDSLFHDDSKIAFGKLQKFWDDGNGERIEITMYFKD